MNRISIITGVVLALAASAPAHSQSAAERIMSRMRTGNTQTNAPLPPPEAQGPITAPPMAVAMKKDMGQQKAFELFPGKVFVAGYNVGGFRTAKTTGYASGGFMSNSAGAATTVELVAWGIDAPLLTRIATAAYADLVAQLQDAGFEVVTHEAAMQTAGADKLKFSPSPYDVSVPADRGNMQGIVVGPALTGARGNYPLAKTEFGSFGAPELSMNLQAMVVMPNLMFDFVSLQSNRSWGFSANASAKLNFGINPALSRMRVMASRRKQFAEGDIVYKLDGKAYAEEPIGEIGDSQRTDNRDQQALAHALGGAVQARSRETSSVNIDRARYEALALGAARGWNAAFVATLKAGTGRP